MKNLNKHMNSFNWQQQFSNCSYPNVQHIDSEISLSDLTTI